MIPARNTRTLLVATAAFVSLATPGHGQGPELLDSTLTVRADSLVDRVEMRLRNPGDSLVVSGAAIESLPPGSGRLRVEEASTPVSIPRNGTTSLRIRGDSTWRAEPPGRYQATLRLQTSRGTVRLPFAITLSSAPPGQVTVRPLVPTLKVRLRRGWPSGRFDGVVQVPLRDSAGPAAAAASPLVHDDSELVFATPLEAVEWREDGAFKAYPVALSGLRGGRTYTGDLQLTAGDEVSKVALVVEASDRIGWVFLTVFLGVLAGITLRRWNEVGRFTSLLKERELRLGERFAAAFALYGKAGGPTASLQDEVTQRRAALEGRFGTLRILLRKDDTLLQALQKEVEELEASVDWITHLAAAQGQLASERDELQRSLANAPRPPAGTPHLSDRPRGLESADSLLLREVTLETLEAATQARSTQAAFLQHLRRTYYDWAEKTAWLQALRHGQTPADQTLLDGAEENLGTVYWAIWDAPDAAQFETRTPDGLLLSVEEVLRKIDADRAEKARVSKRAGVGDAAELAGMALEAGVAAARAERVARAGAVSHASLPVTVQLERAEYIRRVRVLTDLGAGVVSFSAALLGMLLAKYFNHPFGTVNDYVAAFTWGFGVSAGLDLLAMGLASLQPVLARITPRVPTA
jgi:hypothetical protein